MFRNSIIAITACLLLSSCALFDSFKGTAETVGKAAGIINNSDALTLSLVNYIDGDEVATRALLLDDGPADYALQVVDMLTGELDVPIVEIIKTNALDCPLQNAVPCLSEFKPRMEAGRAAVLEYRERTGKPVPAEIQQMWIDGAVVVSRVESAIKANDRLMKAKEVYDTMKPIAGLIKVLIL